MLTYSIPQKAPHSRKREKGYFLLAMMLVVSLMVIAAAIAAPTIAFEIRRDREAEMVHRGVQYTRAIQAYYKKFGRYPTKLEDLDNTNNLRYLRKHYKDPLSKNQDFKLLHYGDPGVTMGFGGGGIAGANTVSQMNAGTAGNSAFGSSGSGFGSSGGFGGNSNSAFGGGNSSFGGGNSSFGGNSSSSFGGGNSSFGGNSNSGFGNSSNSSSGSNSTTSSGSSSNPPAPGDSSQPGSATDSTSQQSGSSNGQGNNQVFGGGPIIGVASLSKETTIREYNKKKKYNEWQFIYDPSADRGGLIRTPYQQGLQNFGQNQLGQPANGTGQQSGAGSSSGFGGSNSSFGNSSGFSNSGSGFGNSSFGSGSSAPSQPPSSSPQPQ